MIVTILLNLFYTIIRVLLSPLLLFPNVSLPLDILAAIESANNYISGFNAIIPAYTIGSVIIFISGLEAIIFSYKIIMWVIRKIPTIN